MKARLAGFYGVFMVLLSALAFGGMVAPVFAAGTGAAWSVTSVATPTYFTAGDGTGDDRYVITVTNTGGASASGSVSVEDVLPAGVTVHGGDIEARDMYLAEPPPVECSGTSVVKCSFAGVMTPGDQLQIVIATDVSEKLIGAGSMVNSVLVSGGGVTQTAVHVPTTLSASQAGFGLARESLVSALSTKQAGAHPNLTVGFGFNENAVDNPSGDVRNIGFDLPPGLVGSGTAVAQCDMASVEASTCPGDTMVGMATATVTRGSSKIAISYIVPIYNIRPYPGEPAAFAFQVTFPVRLDVGVRSDGEYQIHTSSNNLTEVAQIAGTLVTLWGVPADHNGSGPDTTSLTTSERSIHSFGGPGSGPRVPFLTNAALCDGEEQSGELAVDSWEAPGSMLLGGFPNLDDPNWSSSPLGFGPLSGCDQLSFSPSASVAPDSPQAGQPTGYSVDVHVPQNENPDGLGTPPLKDASVMFPVGTVINPSAADGLGACSETQVAMHSLVPVSCPEDSKIATVEVDTPLLAAPLEGSLYLAQQEANPFHSLFATYLVAEGAGVLVKLAGEIHADSTNGQLLTTFKNNPQVPVTDIKIHLAGGPRAPLANPSTCGEASATSLLTSYSGASVTSTSGFPVTGCQAPQFEPSFAALTTNNPGGGFSPLSVTFSRTDQDEAFGSVSVTTPAGLLGILKNVELCPEPQAAQGTCGAASQIGHTTVAAGPGPTPVYLPQAGRPQDPVYLTGPYEGAPFGLSIVVHPEAGPFTLNNGLPVVVRAAIHIDPNTAQLTITSDPFPTILSGIPLQIKVVSVMVDREDFIFNPTSCEPMAITGTLASAHGASMGVSSRFQAADCQSLLFKPKFTASTQARTSRKDGASLDVKVTYPQGPEANIHSVAVSLPKQLPARLTTIQQACRDTTFDVNPAMCPTGSLIGMGVATTPVLAGRLTGPVYLVSHGGAAFPDIDVILQGQGIRVDLTGSINIAKSGVTSSTFGNVPDVPISTFDLVLPEGPHSGLSAVGSLCAKPLTMPTTITAQNGVQIKQTTKVSVKGCPAKPKQKTKPKAKKHKKK